MVKVFRAKINIDNQNIYAYIGNDVDDEGGCVNYLNSIQLAELIGMNEFSTYAENIPTELKLLERQSRWILEDKYMDTCEKFSRLSLWNTKFCAKYLSYYARLGNQKAIGIVCYLTTISLDNIINKAFDCQEDIDLLGDSSQFKLKIDLPPESLLQDVSNYLDRNATSEHDLCIKIIELISQSISYASGDNSGLDSDISKFKSYLLESVENYYTKNISFSTYEWKNLKGSNAPGSGLEKVTRAVLAIMSHNDNQWKKANKYCLTARAVMDLTGSRHSVVKKYFDDHAEKIDDHNKKNNLAPVHNRGKKPITEVVQVL
jgi:hypothetical protein